MLRQVVAAGCLLGAANRAEALAMLGLVPGLSPSAKIGEWLRSWTRQIRVSTGGSVPCNLTAWPSCMSCAS